MMMDLQILYQLRDYLIQEGVSPDSADVCARLYPFFLEYEYGVSITQAAEFLDHSGKQVRRQFHELTEKGFLKRDHYRAWRIAEVVKEKFDGAS
jgi:hypothetical protein